jgi:hypothetical protein
VKEGFICGEIMNDIKTIRRWFLVVVCVFGVGDAQPSTAQEGTKGIRSAEVIKQPLKPSAGKQKSGTNPRRSVTYRSSKPFTEYVSVGVTIWRLQGDSSKGLDQVGEEEQTLEQVEANTQLAIGSNVRLGIVPLTSEGYLYVIDREHFAKDSYGTPRLIFPTLRTRNGNNFVRVNERILIPRRPSYFRINPSSTGRMQTAEVLTIIISPTPLRLPARLGDTPIVLDDKQFKEWEAAWSAPVNELEMEEGAGETIGAKDLGQVGEEAQELTEDDPMPQTVYRANVQRGKPLLVTVPLHFASTVRSTRPPK